MQIFGSIAVPFDSEGIATLKTNKPDQSTLIAEIVVSFSDFAFTNSKDHEMDVSYTTLKKATGSFVAPRPWSPYSC